MQHRSFIGRYSGEEMKKRRFIHCCQSRLRESRAIVKPRLTPNIFSFGLIPKPPYENHPQVIKQRDDFFQGIADPPVKKKGNTFDSCLLALWQN